jgi:hypothetical protein
METKDMKIKATMNIDGVLDERGSRYGSFEENAFVVQGIKEILHNNLNWDDMKPIQKEALDMIAHKMARIVSGDPDYIDNWVDIAGYAKLVVDNLERRK